MNNGIDREHAHTADNPAAKHARNYLAVIQLLTTNQDLKEAAREIPVEEVDPDWVAYVAMIVKYPPK